MCNEISRKTALDDLLREFEILSPPPRFEWEGGATPNDLAGKASVRIRDTSPVFRLNGGTLVGSMIPWAWPGPKGAPVFNFRSEGRDFAHSDRVLIFADGFYEYTAPAAPKVKLKDQHYFTRAAGGWFWIAGLVKDGCFSLLTTQPGSDVAPYHDRQIVTLPPQAGLDWLTLARPQGELLRAEPAGTFRVETLRRDGVVLAEDLF
ncbi:SOS response-associated peptidase family protein [Phenylobacterium aquaticum]|uniref:SOS response-associated peptidase family protein n=1 Tax=Phenylobacterium aquaticum TaxID=1763816 RepID=UPI0026EB64EC|nr:SOS response-associated peptidase family protein [Phenylobacterium aquaticum]